MGGPAFNAANSNRPGPHPSLLPYGGYECQTVVAADLTPLWQEWLRACPDGDFARFGLIKKFARAFDSAIKRKFIEACGYHAGGQWQYRLTTYGRAVRDVLREA